MDVLRHPEVVVTLRRELRRAARVGAFGTTTALMLPAFMARTAVATPKGRDAVRDRWVGAWCRTLLHAFGVEVIVAGAPGLEGAAARGRLVVANHRSTADILALLGAFGGAMVSRADVAGWPLIGAAARAVGTVFVDRSNAFSGATAVRAIRARLVRGGTVIVFPEGGTSSGDEVRPFRRGAFVAALRADAEVVPVGLAYSSGSEAAFVGESFPAHLARMAAARPSKVAMCIGAPISSAPGSHAESLRDSAQADVARLVAQARALVDA
jgi:1-acyl-sn-glycerol-3-phosphate acyltransferase